MENNDKINLVKDILYEESTQRLLKQTVVVKSIYPVYKWLVAAAVIGIASLIGFNMLNSDSQDRALMAYNYHDFPVITKSRGAQQNIVDSHLADINQDNYETVLPLLKGNDLSEKDKFVKALMLFRLGEYAKAKKLITSTQWKDPYHQSELDWVMYLMAYVSGDSLVNLESTLSNAYQVKAKKLLLQ